MRVLNIENMHNSDAKEKHINRKISLVATGYFLIGATVAFHKFSFSRIVLCSYTSIATISLNECALKTCPVMKGSRMY